MSTELQIANVSAFLKSHGNAKTSESAETLRSSIISSVNVIILGQESREGGSGAS